jgi:hypothetical protein
MTQTRLGMRVCIKGLNKTSILQSINKSTILKEGDLNEQRRMAILPGLRGQNADADTRGHGTHQFLIFAILPLINPVVREGYLMKESKAVTFIGGFYIFGSIIVLLSLIFGGSALNTVFDVPQISDSIVKLFVGFFFAPSGFLYVKRTRIGYWLVLLSSILFFCVSATFTTELNVQPYIGNMIYSLFVIVITVLKRKEFCHSIRAVLKKKVQVGQ